MIFPVLLKDLPDRFKCSLMARQNRNIDNAKTIRKPLNDEEENG
jgi:hypothetical protein